MPATTKGHRPLRTIVAALATCLFAHGLLQGQTMSALRGIVTDPSGAAVYGAQVLVQIRGQENSNAAGYPLKLTTDEAGQFFAQNLPIGSYIITISLRGFITKILDNVEVKAGQAATLTIELAVAATSETIEVSGSPGKKQGAREFKNLTWNVWEEKYSSEPSFVPTKKLLVDKQYSLVLDLSALEYGGETGSFGQPISASFDTWLKRSTGPQATLDILVVPDERFFQAQREDERVKKFNIDLDKLRRTRSQGFKLKGSAFGYLKKHKDAEFSFGRQLFLIQSKTQTGSAAIAVSIWVDGRPVDEISVPLCIVKQTSDPCSTVRPPDMSLRGVDSISHGVFPDAALHLIELDSTTVIGVFRCNSCPDWKPDEYRHWVLGRSASWLSDMLTKTLLPGFEQASLSGDENAFLNVGTALYGAVFQRDEGNGQPSYAEKGFTSFVAAALKSEAPGRVPPSIFVRILPHNADPLFLFPLGLMAVRLPDGTSPFLGFHFRVQTPLELQDYTSSSSCLSNWVLLVPPEGISNAALQAARSGFGDWIKAFDGWQGHALVDEDLGKFGDWLEQRVNDDQSTVIFILSHHDVNKLVFDTDSEVPAVFSTNIGRRFGVPSLAIINACGTAEPGAFDFVRELNRSGVNSVIATNTEVDGAMAGQFASILLNLLHEHADDPNYTLDLAKFDAVNELSKLPAASPYGPRALIFSLLGNGNVKVCTPASNN